MKINSDIPIVLEKIQRSLRKNAKVLKDLADVQNDRDQLQKTIDGLGEPSYKDDAKITQLATSRLKLDLCEKEITRLQEKLGDSDDQNRELLRQGGSLAQEVLIPILGRRRETIAASIRPFCNSAALTIDLAQRTDSYVYASEANAGFSRRASMAQWVGTEQIFAGLAQIEAVLREAIKGTGADLMPFLAGPPAAATASAAAETSTAVASEKGEAQQ